MTVVAARRRTGRGGIDVRVDAIGFSSLQLIGVGRLLTFAMVAFAAVILVGRLPFALRRMPFLGKSGPRRRQKKDRQQTKSELQPQHFRHRQLTPGGRRSRCRSGARPRTAFEE